MLYFPIFDRIEYDFIGIYGCSKYPMAKCIKIPCMLAHTFEEIARHANLMNEIVNAVREDRESNITKEDQEFIDHYQSFYIDLQFTMEGYEIATIDLTPYSKINIENIKHFLAFKSIYFNEIT